MALEHFKTQVLLLHSQQSTLDVLSTGFGERYAVHVATSGTEALNTLGETPIHVLVSAQDLPGMSGLEALREAKKRSPDTIGILLAGNDRDDGLEALVDDQEVFQIVRGTITPEALRNLIDTATKQIRLLAISESANDKAANVDEPAGEHIVMETSEHGATLITDGTGRLPVLNNPSVHVSPNPAGRNVDVLVLTKDEEFLETIKESSRGLHNVHSANTPAQAEAIVRNHKVGVLVTDAAMVGSKIEAVTEKLRKDVPRLIAIVAGRRDDGELLMDLINRGQVYRFLLKPVSPGRARLAIEASVKRHLEGADAASGSKARSNKTPTEASQTSAKPAASPKATPAPDPDAADKQARQKTDSAAAEEISTGNLRDSGRFTETMSGLAASVRMSGAYAAKSSGANSGTADDGSAGRFLNPKVLSASGAALAIIAAAAWWIGTSDTPVDKPAPVEETAQTTSTPSPSVVETDIPAQDRASAVLPPPAWQAKLDEARAARDAGALIAPPEDNAIELYLAARAMAADEPVIATELEAVINQTLGIAETALLEQRTEDAAAALRMARLADPDNPRLPFLDAQVAELQLRSELDRARAAIREGRFEDAATALAAAETLAGSDQADVTVLAEELATARSEQQVDEVLALANQRMSEDALTAPSNDNARYYYELVLSTDPGNTAALQGLTVVANKLVMRSREAIDAGRLDDAELILQDAAELDPGSSELTASLQALETARAEEEALRQAELQKQAAAEQAAKAALAGAAPNAGGTGTEGTAARTFGTGDDASIYGIEGSAPTDGDAGGSSAPDLAANSAPASNEADASASGDAVSYTEGYVPISSLTRTNYVVPEYPRSARRRNITGWVDVTFTVNARGNVEDIGILNSNPDDIFNESAREAISDWRFEPPVENGSPVKKRVAVRLSYNLE